MDQESKEVVYTVIGIVLNFLISFGVIKHTNENEVEFTLPSEAIEESEVVNPSHTL